MLASIIGSLVPLTEVQAAAGLQIRSQMAAQARLAATKVPGPGKPNRFNPSSASQSVTHPRARQPTRGASSSTAPAGTSAGMQRSTPFAAPVSFPLNVGLPSHFLSKDGLLGIDVPAGAVSASDVAADGGTTSLSVQQVSPMSGSNAGGSGEFSFGTYLLQVLNAKGDVANHGLRQPITVKIHYGNGGGASALDLANSYMIMNGASLPASVSARLGTASLGPQSTTSTTLDTTNQTLDGSATLLNPSGTLAMGADTPVATFGQPQPFEADLSGGSLTASYPLNLPAGPKGIAPPVSLSYSSAALSEQHNPQGAASWVGEGFNLSMGSITWAEHSVADAGSDYWSDSWNFSDPFGNSATLIPPTANTAIWLEDSGHPITSGVVLWQTDPEIYAKVYSFKSKLTLPNTSTAPPCFRVFLSNGIMEEFGCTADSLEYYPGQYGANIWPFIYSWLLDMIVEPDGNQIHATYQRDMQTSQGMSYPRDAVLSSVQWDSPTCISTSSLCTTSGTAPNLWKPLLQVSFAANHSVNHVIGGSCAPTGTLRCDDPKSVSGGLSAPLVQSDFVLSDASVQVCDSPPCSTGWKTLRDYQFAYQQTTTSTITDPLSGLQEQVAGLLALRWVLTIGDDSPSTILTESFTYVRQYEYYEDSNMSAYPNCGPAWNTGDGDNCLLWSQSYNGNSYYLATVSNGIGLTESFAWQDNRDNAHGVTSGGYPADPMYCTNAQAGVTGYSGGSAFPCNMADDQTWSRASLTSQTNTVVRLTQDGQGGTQASTPIAGTTSYTYEDAYPLANEQCSTCVAGYSWGSSYDFDYADFYNGMFMGYAQVSVTNPDGSLAVHNFYSTEGWGGWTANGTNGLTDTCPHNPYWTTVCNADPYWDIASQNTYPGQANALHGHEYDAYYYDTNGTTLLERVETQYNAVCSPPIITSLSPNISGYTNNNWGGNLVSGLDWANPEVPCDDQVSQVDDYKYDSANGPVTVPDQTTTYAYETGTRPCATCYGREIKTTTTSNNGSANSNPSSVVKTTAYIWNDHVTWTVTPQGSYLIDFPAFSDTEDTSGNRYSCNYITYDPATGGGTGANLNLLNGNLTKQTSYTSCGTSPNFTPSGPITITYGYDAYGNSVSKDDADANAGITSHYLNGCTVSGTKYSNCTTFDGSFAALPTQQANVLNQATSATYQPLASATAGFGWGLWPMSTTDANGQITSYTYDGLDRPLSVTAPLETTGYNTENLSYTIWCATSGAQSPCDEHDTTQRLNSAQTVTSRSFYDGNGKLVETRTPATSTKDRVQYYLYDPFGQLVFKSIPYLVTAWTGAPGVNAYSIPDSRVAGTCIGSGYGCSIPGYDGLGRVKVTTDPLSETTTTSYSVVCNAAGTGDSACYNQVATVDPLGHKSSTLTDAMGRTFYEQKYTGNSGSTYWVYATTKYAYNYMGEQVWILQPNGTATTTSTYDMAGRLIGTTNPDSGTFASTACPVVTGEPPLPANVSDCYAYDQDGNMTESMDARGSAGTVLTAYDGINRPISRGPDTYTYDSTSGGNVGVGRLTSETFAGGGLSGSQSYVYDARGRQTSTTLTIGSSSYPSGATYDDANRVLTQTYPDGETVTNFYGGGDSQSFLSGVNTSIQPGATLLNSATYTGTGGAEGAITSAIWEQTASGKTYTYSAAFDLLGRGTDINVKNGSLTVMFDQARTFDAGGNVSTIDTTLTAGTDNQAFCYDEQNRLTAAASIGTLPSGCPTFSAGTLTAADYSQTFAYDNMGRLTSGALGTYTYGNSTHVDAVTAIGGLYTAAYDAAGDMTCRAPNSATTCSGTQTGAQLTYNSQGQLAGWQNQPSGPTSTDAYLYDGQGNRVAQQTVSGGVTTTTAYVGNIEEDATTSGVTTKTTYYYANGQRFAMAVNGVISYLASDGLGSANVTLDASGNVVAQVLYAPYGAVRYGSGTMPTSYGFTGQLADAATGLDYYGARYYDPVAGQFASADTVLPGNGLDIWGLSRYAYVEGNPIIRTDPTGHVFASGPPGGCDPCNTPPPASSKPPPPTTSCDLWCRLQNGATWVGEQLPSGARASYVSALSASGTEIGREHNALVSGDPRQWVTVPAVDTLILGAAALCLGLCGSVFAAVARLSALASAAIGSAKGLAGDTSPAADTTIGISENAAGHIFRDSVGHLVEDSAGNRALLTDTANNAANKLGTDQWGNDWYTQMQSDGSQIWTRVRDGQITNGGVNSTPWQNFGPGGLQPS